MRFSCNLAAKVTLKDDTYGRQSENDEPQLLFSKMPQSDDTYGRQSEKAAGVCALTEQRIAWKLFAATSRIGS